jgi:hypothetical protein
MIRLGQRELEVPLWLWAAIPFAFIVYGLYDGTSYIRFGDDCDRQYLAIVRQLAAPALAGFLTIDLIRRSMTPWYGAPLVLLASLAASKIAIDWLSGGFWDIATTVTGLAISAAGSRGGAGIAGLILVTIMLGVPFLSGLMLSLLFTIGERFVAGLPVFARDTRREFWANLAGAFVWLALATGGYVAIRSWFGLQYGFGASGAVPSWLPKVAAVFAAVAATALHLRVAHRSRRRQFLVRGSLRISALAVLCVAALIYQPAVFGATGRTLTYDYIRPALRAVHVLATPALTVANYEADVPFHDFKTRQGTPMPDGKPSSLLVPLPAEYGLTSTMSHPTVFILRRDITLQQVSSFWMDRRKALDDMQSKQPGADAVIWSSSPRSALALRTDDYPDVDFEVTDLDAATSSDVAEQALRRFLRERLRRIR